ncbi:unnamed protein product, partial [Symbiodinium sp. CCMP2592]
INATTEQMYAELTKAAYMDQLSDLRQALQDTRALLDKLGDPIEESKNRIIELHDSYKKSHLAETMKMLASKAETDEVEKLSKLVKAELLKMMQQFAAAETVQDSILKQGRDMLLCLQGELKTMSDKIVAIDTGMERSLNLHKTLSNELHVAKTVLEQKLDKANKALVDHQGPVFIQASFPAGSDLEVHWRRHERRSRLSCLP